MAGDSLILAILRVSAAQARWHTACPAGSVGRDAVRRATRCPTNLVAVVVTQAEAVGEVRPSRETVGEQLVRAAQLVRSQDPRPGSPSSDRSPSPLAR